MKNCVRCGKPIDVISKDPNKVFYCMDCSYEVLKISSGTLGKNETNESIKNGIAYFIPGIFDIKNSRILEGITKIISFLISFYIIFDNKTLNKDFKYCVIIYILLLFLSNYREIKWKKHGS